MPKWVYWSTQILLALVVGVSVLHWHDYKEEQEEAVHAAQCEAYRSEVAGRLQALENEIFTE
jgi:hypothetical protein